MTSLSELLSEIWADQRIRVLLIAATVTSIAGLVLGLPVAVLLAVAIGFLIGIIYIELTEKETVEVTLPEKRPPPLKEMPPGAEEGEELEFGVGVIGEKEIPPPPTEYAEEKIAELGKVIEEQSTEIEALKKERAQLIDYLIKARDRLKETVKEKMEESKVSAKKVRESTSFVDLSKKYGIDPVVLDSVVSALEGIETPAELPIEWFSDYVTDINLVPLYIKAIRKLKFKIAKKGQTYWLL